MNDSVSMLCFTIGKTLPIPLHLKVFSTSKHLRTALKLSNGLGGMGHVTVRQ